MCFLPVPSPIILNLEWHAVLYIKRTRLNVLKPVRKALTGAFAIFLLGLAVWAFAIEPASLRIRTYSLAIPDWPDHLDGISIAVLADLHTGSPFNGLEKLREIVAQANSAHCDLVLIAGDLVIQGVLGGTFISPEESTNILRDLHAPLGVYAVLGNHDWWLDANRVRKALEGASIPVLEDDAIELKMRNRSFWLSGISDFWEGPHNVEAALQKIPPHAPIIVFTHNPDVFPQVPARVAFTIAGHTHGGQVQLPFVGRPVVPSQYGERFAVGHIVENGRHMFVSTGLGTSILPVRFRVPPEISILTISGQAGERVH
ncbi:MAG TPA: metallophosphoesterase [Nitrospira sp.]|nr:metallophosphoesterase [Nitrospira sp.]